MITQEITTNFTIGSCDEIEGNFDHNCLVISDGNSRIQMDLDDFDILVEAYRRHKTTCRNAEQDLTRPYEEQN